MIRPRDECWSLLPTGLGPASTSPLQCPPPRKRIIGKTNQDTERKTPLWTLQTAKLKLASFSEEKGKLAENRRGVGNGSYSPERRVRESCWAPPAPPFPRCFFSLPEGRAQSHSGTGLDRLPGQGPGVPHGDWSPGTVNVTACTAPAACPRHCQSGRLGRPTSAPRSQPRDCWVFCCPRDQGKQPVLPISETRPTVWSCNCIEKNLIFTFMTSLIHTLSWRHFLSLGGRSCEKRLSTNCARCLYPPKERGLPGHAPRPCACSSIRSQPSERSHLSLAPGRARGLQQLPRHTQRPRIGATRTARGGGPEDQRGHRDLESCCLPPSVPGAPRCYMETLEATVSWFKWKAKF